MENIYMPEIAAVEEIKQETSNIRTLTLSFKNPRSLDASPGQFVELTIFGYGEFPVSIASVLGPQKERFQTTIQQRGKATNEIQSLDVGSTIGIRGPFGNSFPMEEMKGKDIYLVTGGIGLAAIRYLLDHLLENRDQYGNLKLLYGARTPDDLIYRDSLIFQKGKAEKNGLDILMAVEHPDSNWQGHVGLVTELFDKTGINPSNSIAAVCGPSVMMKSASMGLVDMGFNEEHIFLSMERRMQCGMGMCGHCMMGRKRVCLDGPVLSYGGIKGALERIF
jgi:NAD(P)H-flavin reductase